jgi:hypothetical protein
LAWAAPADSSPHSARAGIATPRARWSGDVIRASSLVAPLTRATLLSWRPDRKGRDVGWRRSRPRPYRGAAASSIAPRAKRDARLYIAARSLR